MSVEGKCLKEIVARTVEDVEHQVIRSTLMDSGWKKSRAAEVLGISRPTLDAKIDKYTLTREDVVGEGGTGNGQSSTRRRASRDQEPSSN